MIVQPLIGTTGFPSHDSNGARSLAPFVYRVSEVSIGTDPTVHPMIPLPGSELTIGADKYVCDRVGVTQLISDTACDVTAWFSNDGRFRFPTIRPNDESPTFLDYDLGYKKTQIEVPQFLKGQRTARNAAGALVTGDYWYKDYKTLDIEQDVLNVRINIEGLSNENIRQIIRDIRLQRGKLHEFFDSFWVMQMPFIRSYKADGISIAYAWVSDPGSGALDVPAGVLPSDCVTAPGRPPFYVYSVVPTSQITLIPRITVQDLFPLTLPGGGANPRVDLNGWRNLPGRPI